MITASFSRFSTCSTVCVTSLHPRRVSGIENCLTYRHRSKLTVPPDVCWCYRWPSTVFRFFSLLSQCSTGVFVYFTFFFSFSVSWLTFRMFSLFCFSDFVLHPIIDVRALPVRSDPVHKLWTRELSSVQLVGMKAAQLFSLSIHHYVRVGCPFDQLFNHDLVF